MSETSATVTAAASEQRDRVSLLVRLEHTATHVQRLLDGAYRQLAAAEELFSADFGDEGRAPLGELRRVGVDREEMERVDISHRLRVAHNAMEEVDSRAVEVAADTAHDLAAYLQHLRELAELSGSGDERG